MKKIYNNLSIENLVRTDWINQFNQDQRREISYGIRSNLKNIEIYAKKEYKAEQMTEIRMGLTSNIDVSFYANPVFDWRQMEQIRQGLELCLDVSVYSNVNFDWQQMRQIKSGLEKT